MNTRRTKRVIAGCATALFATIAGSASAQVGIAVPARAMTGAACDETGPTLVMIEPGAAALTGKPYSATGRSRVVTTLADGNRIVRETITRQYRDGAGRTRMEHEFSGVGPFALASPHRLVTIDDPVANAHYVLHPELKRADVLPAGAGGPFTAAVRAPAPAGERDELFTRPAHGTCEKFTRKLPDSHRLGTKMLAGLKVEGTRLEFQIPAGEIGNEAPLNNSMEQWLSPELGVVVASVHRDALMGETTFTLEKIVRAEPDAELFKVPADFTVNRLPADADHILLGPGPGGPFNLPVPPPAMRP